MKRFVKPIVISSCYSPVIHRKSNKRIAVIGSGIAGIAAAIRLSQAGFEVDVFEANQSAGGKISEFSQNHFRFDAGPSLLTLPELIDELFLLCGKEPREYFKYRKLDILCNYFFPDGLQLTAYAGREKFASEISAKTTVSKEKVLNYLQRSQSLYELTDPVFLQSSLHNYKTYTKNKSWRAFFSLHKLDSNMSLHERNERYFQEPHIVQLFDRYATYNGSDPFLAPATLKVIPHLEYNLGAYFPEGGMYSIIQSLVQLAKESGVKFHFGSKVEKIIIQNKRAKKIVVNNEEKDVDAVVSNMDVFNTYALLLPAERMPKNIRLQSSSSSAIVFYWGLKKQFPLLDLHNIFFSSDYKMEFEFLTRRKQICSDPTVYVNISSKLKKDDAPAGCENWFAMINAPHLAGQDWNELISEARKNILLKLEKMLGENIGDSIISERVLDPQLIESNTFSHLGALYGTSSNDRWAAFLRTKNFSSRIKNLFFCGGSVHPGGGIPLCLYSAKIVTDLVTRNFR